MTEITEAGAPSGPRALRKTRSDGERTRQAILREAASLATVDGLDGLTIGHLAKSLGISKSGLYAHFESKEALQLATVETAAGIFAAEVVGPAMAAEPGLAQLRALCEAFFGHLERRTFPGGCFMASAALEMGTRPGAVKTLIAAFQQQFTAVIRGFAVTAIEMGELGPEENADQLTFELNGIILAADTNFVLHDEPEQLDLARQVVRRRLARADQPGSGPVATG
jgi:AcrR family transcriptional regulator